MSNSRLFCVGAICGGLFQTAASFFVGQHHLLVEIAVHTAWAFAGGTVGVAFFGDADRRKDRA